MPSYRVILATILVVALAGCERPVLRVGDRLPSFVIEGLEGEPVTDELVRGRILVLHLYDPFNYEANESALFITKAHQELQGGPVVFLTAARDNRNEPAGWDEIREAVVRTIPGNATNWKVALNMGPEPLYPREKGTIVGHNEVLAFDLGGVMRVKVHGLRDTTCLVTNVRNIVEGTLQDPGIYC